MRKKDLLAHMSWERNYRIERGRGFTENSYRKRCAWEGKYLDFSTTLTFDILHILRQTGGGRERGKGGRGVLSFFCDTIILSILEARRFLHI